MKVLQLHPAGNCATGRLRKLELYGERRLLPHHGRAGSNAFTIANVTHPELDEVARAWLAIQAQVEQSELSGARFQLKPDPDCPNFHRHRFLGRACAFTGGFEFGDHGVHINAFGGEQGIQRVA